MEHRAVLGISAYYHDSAAALVAGDGSNVAAAQEERFSREKRTNAFPRSAIEFVLSSGKTSLEELDAIVFYDKPLLKLERLLETTHALAPKGAGYFVATAPYWTKRQLSTRTLIAKELKRINGSAGPVARLLFAEHHFTRRARSILRRSGRSGDTHR